MNLPRLSFAWNGLAFAKGSELPGVLNGSCALKGSEVAKGSLALVVSKGFGFAEKVVAFAEENVAFVAEKGA